MGKYAKGCKDLPVLKEENSEMICGHKFRSSKNVKYRYDSWGKGLDHNMNSAERAGRSRKYESGTGTRNDTGNGTNFAG